MMKLKDFGKLVKNNLSDTDNKRFILHIVLLLLEVIVLSVGGSLLGLFSFGFWLRPILERMSAPESTVICAAGFVFLLILSSIIAWHAGKRPQKKKKLSVRNRFLTDLIATGLYVLPGLIIFCIYTKSDGDWVKSLITYMPYLCFRNILKHDVLSLAVSALLSVGVRTGLYTLGKLVWKSRGGEDQ